MSESNYNNECSFSEQAISYIYGEIGAPEKTAFEHHLKTCSTCTNEIDGFGSARAAVAFWKENEFDTLTTPKVEFSNVQSQKAIPKNVSSVEKKSWLLALQTLFQPRTVLAGGLAALLIFGGLIFFARNSAVDNQSATIGDKNENQSIDYSTNESKQAEIAETRMTEPDSPPNSVLKSSSDGNSKVGIERAKSLAANTGKNTLVDANKNSAKTNKPAEIAALPQNKITARRHSGAAHSLVSERASNNKKRIPVLNEIEIDDEETSLRLTDLLDEVGGK